MYTEYTSYSSTVWIKLTHTSDDLRPWVHSAKITSMVEQPRRSLRSPLGRQTETKITLDNGDVLYVEQTPEQIFDLMKGK